MLNLDTHLVVALLDGSLNSKETTLVSVEPLAVSPIVFWELAKLVQLRRLTMDFDTLEFRNFLRQVTVIPITFEIALASTQLDFHSDPADQIIAATSMIHRIPLLTRDRKIRKSKIVPFA
jgi:PIN domain nuclease of toxin-antitoxin system